ncbi:MAG: glycerol-3-phosphate acyltransferase, partial [Chloroflexi bacterium]|nr:glycerol-3-phosphate acyltransferase [Chloroflexota bacterium]
GACALVGVLVAAITRYVSVGSVVGAVASLVCVLVLVALGSMSPLYLVFGLGGFAIILFRHWENMARVARGEENRIGRPSRPRRARRTAAPAESPR